MPIAFLLPLFFLVTQKKKFTHSLSLFFQIINYRRMSDFISMRAINHRVLHLPRSVSIYVCLPYHLDHVLNISFLVQVLEQLRDILLYLCRARFPPMLGLDFLDKVSYLTGLHLPIIFEDLYTTLNRVAAMQSRQ